MSVTLRMLRQGRDVELFIRRTRTVILIRQEPPCSDVPSAAFEQSEGCDACFRSSLLLHMQIHFDKPETVTSINEVCHVAAESGALKSTFAEPQMPRMLTVSHKSHQPPCVAERAH